MTVETIDGKLSASLADVDVVATDTCCVVAARGLTVDEHDGDASQGGLVDHRAQALGLVGCDDDEVVTLAYEPADVFGLALHALGAELDVQVNLGIRVGFALEVTHHLHVPVIVKTLRDGDAVGVVAASCKCEDERESKD